MEVTKTLLSWTLFISVVKLFTQPHQYIVLFTFHNRPRDLAAGCVLQPLGYTVLCMKKKRSACSKYTIPIDVSYPPPTDLSQPSTFTNRFHITLHPQMNEQELMRRDLTQLMTRVENLQSQNQRLHALLLALTNLTRRGDDGGRERADTELDLAKYIWWWTYQRRHRPGCGRVRVYLATWPNTVYDILYCMCLWMIHSNGREQIGTLILRYVLFFPYPVVL